MSALGAGVCGFEILESPPGRPIDPCSQGAIVLDPTSAVDGASFELARDEIACVRGENVGGTGSAEITIDGTRVLAPPAFSATVPVAEARVELTAGAHTLGVRTPGRDPSVVQLTISSSPLAAAVPIASGTTGHLAAQGLYHWPEVLVPELGGLPATIDLGLDGLVTRAAGLPSPRTTHRLRYRFEIRAASSCDLVAELAGEADVVGGTQSLRASWDGRGPGGALVSVGEYIYRAHLELVRVDDRGRVLSTLDRLDTPARLFEVASDDERDPPVVHAESGLRLDLDRIVYRGDDTLSATLRRQSGALHAARVQVVVVSSQTQDVELLDLAASSPDRWTTGAPLTVEVTSEGRRLFDGRLQARPGELLVATFYPDYARHPEIEGRTQMIVDWAIVAREDGLPPAPSILPALAITPDDLAGASPGPRPIATLFTSPGLPVQVAADEVIFYPRSEAELASFLARTGGLVLGHDPPGPPDELAESYLVRVDPSGARVADLSHYQLLVGSDEALLASAEAGLEIVAYALALVIDGYSVALDPRLELMAPPRLREHPACGTGPTDCLDDDDRNRGELYQDAFGVLPYISRAPVPTGPPYLSLWAQTALMDIDESKVLVAFIDAGFAAGAANPDFPLPALECLASGLTPSAFECGTGIAQRPASGIPGFWHGTLVVSTAAAALNNGFGNAGIGGQVVSPMLYTGEWPLFAFGLGSAIRHAVDRDASVINISAGFPCKAPTSFGLSYGLCTSEEVLLTCGRVAERIMESALAACAALSWEPFLGPIVCGVAGAAFATAVGACTTALGIPRADVRGPLRGAVEYAAARGVPVVASAGNNLSPDAVAALGTLVDASERRSEAWELIPCTLPYVICVGHAQQFWPHDNLEWYGSAVDIWAPAATQYWAPQDVANVSSPVTYYWTPGQTSGAAAYISGTVALLMAVDRELDPVMTRRTGVDLAAIPADIVALLQRFGTASTPATPDRGALVNPGALIRDALERRDSFAYRYPVWWVPEAWGDFDLREESPDPSDAPPGVELSVRHFYETGSVVAIPGLGGAHASVDRDWFHVNIPPDLGYYEVVIQVESPVAADGTPDPPLLLGDLFELESEVLDPPGPPGVTRGQSLEQRYRSREMLEGQVVAFALSAGADGRHDNHYLVRFISTTRVREREGPDRFDRPNPSNPLESTPNNNEPARAVRLGERADAFAADLGWVATACIPADACEESSVHIAGLNLSLTEQPDGTWSEDREDFFYLPQVPEHRVWGTCEACQIRDLWVQAPSTVRVAFHNACNGNTMRRDLREPAEGWLDVTAAMREGTLGPGGCIGIELSRGGAGIVESYDVTVRYRTSGESCVRGCP